MMKLACVVCVGVITLGSDAAYAGQAPAARGSAGAERFEVSSIKGVRPTLVNTVAALKKGDVASAKAAFEAYDSGWNGIEVYINTRSKELYNELELHLQADITKARRLLGYEPIVPFEEGIRRTVEWYRGVAASS